MNNSTPFAWYTIEENETHICLIFRNKKGVERIEYRRPLWTGQDGYKELEEIKKRLEERKARIGKIMGEAVKAAMELAKNDPEEFKRRFKHD